jgi:hypothetical protein
MIRHDRPLPNPPPRSRWLLWGGSLSVLVLTVSFGCGPNVTHPPPQAYQPATPETLTCIPDLDGTITAAYMQPALGIPENFLVSAAGTQPQVDLVGQVDSAGHRVWDWSASSATDQALQIEATSLSGKPYASSFPSGQFAVPFDAAKTLDAIYVEDSQAISLLGIASSQSTSNPTLLAYQQPVPVYQFPMQVGATWTSVGAVVNGSLQGLPYAGQDTYQVSVDSSGDLELPDLGFQQVLKVSTALTTVPVAGNPVTVRQVSFLFQCFGEVARATSLNNETNPNFTTASEVRRLGL